MTLLEIQAYINTLGGVFQSQLAIATIIWTIGVLDPANNQGNNEAKTTLAVKIVAQGTGFLTLAETNFVGTRLALLGASETPADGQIQDLVNEFLNRYSVASLSVAD